MLGIILGVASVVTMSAIVKGLEQGMRESIIVYGGREDRVAACTHGLTDGDELMVGALAVRAIHVPCHTRGSMCFLIDGRTPSVFGGDTLFCGGCGAPFEGSQAEMGRNFIKLWRSCAPNTLVFPVADTHSNTPAHSAGLLLGPAAISC